MDRILDRDLCDAVIHPQAVVVLFANIRHWRSLFNLRASATLRTVGALSSNIRGTGVRWVAKSAKYLHGHSIDF
jgi:hypothetical protein